MVIALGVFVLAPAAFIYAADPCHVFHKPFNQFFHHGFTPETRCQNAGLINSWLSDQHEGYDSILVGASTSENFPIAYINQKTPWKKTLMLTMVNMAPVEQNIVIEKSIRTGNVQHVYWEILPMLHHSPKPMDFDSITKTTYFPAYLYNNNRLDDYRYIFNAFTFSGAIDVLTKEPYFVNDINKIRYWENRCESENICNQFLGKEDIENIQAHYIAPTRRHLSDKEVNGITYTDFDNFIKPIIEKNCGGSISFDIYFPPSSLLWFAQLSDSDFNYELYLMRHTVKQIHDCPNMRAFSFYNELWITGDLSNYGDPKHFYGDIPKFIIDAMADDRNRITADNIRDFEISMINNLNAYRPYGTKLYPH